jgi:hypothetical protein
MATFAYRGQLNGAENPIVVHAMINNSDTVAVGEALSCDTFSNGSGAIRATAGSKVFGICVGIVDSEGIDLRNTKKTLKGTWTKGTNTYAAASDNLTVDMVSAIVNIDPLSLWENKTAGALATADLFKFFDLTSATQIADQNGTDAAGAFQLMKLDPSALGDTTVGLFKISESIFGFAVQQ